MLPPYALSPRHLHDAGRRSHGRDPPGTAALTSVVRPTTDAPCVVGCPVSRDTVHCAIIKTFADRRTQALYVMGTAKRFSPDVAARATPKLLYVDLATSLDDLKVPPGNGLHALKDDRKGQHAIAINDQWHICFRFVEGDAYDVEVCDYH